MSQRFTEGRLTFEFPDAWSVCRPSATLYYTNRFQSFCGGCKETDFAVFDPNGGKLWLLEVKDYAAHPRTKALPLQEEIALKVRDTLALLTASATCDQTPSTPAALQAGDFGRIARAATSLGVVLHCEVQPHQAVLFPAVSHMANLLQALRASLKAVDPNAKIARMGAYAGLTWTVVQTPP